MLSLANMTLEQFNENRVKFEDGIEFSYKQLAKLVNKNA